MADFVRRSRQLYQDQVNPKPLLIHCWRGGMRSGSVAWLLETAGIPVIMITTKDQETDKIWGMRQGAVEYLVKPIDEKQLVAKINAVMAA